MEIRINVCSTSNKLVKSSSFDLVPNIVMLLQRLIPGSLLFVDYDIILIVSIICVIVLRPNTAYIHYILVHTF